MPPHAVENPSQGIDDVVVVRLELDGALDERVCLFIPVGAIGKGVTEGIQSVGMVGLARNDRTHVVLDDVQTIHLRGEHPARVQEVRISGECVQRRVVDLHRFVVAPDAREQPGLGAVDAHRFLDGLAAHPVQMTPCRFDVAAIRQQHCDPDLRIQPVFAASDTPIRVDGVGESALGLRDSSQVVARGVTPRVAAREHLELLCRLVEPVRLHEQQPERVACVVVSGLHRHQVLEFRAGAVVASRVHEHPCIGHADHSGFGLPLEKFFQHGDRTVDVVRPLAQARPQDCDTPIAGIEVVRAIGGRRGLLDVSGPKQEPGKRKLRLRVVLVPENELPHRGRRGFCVLLCGKELGGTVKSRARRFGQRTRDHVEVFDRLVDILRPYQQGCQDLPGFQARWIGVLPQVGRLEGAFVGVCEDRELRRPCRNGRVPGLLGDVQVVSHCKEQVAAVAGELSDQELVEYVSAQRIRGRRGIARIARADRDCPGRCGTGGGASGERSRRECGSKREPAKPPTDGHAQPLRRADPFPQRSYRHRRLSIRLVRTINYRRYNAFVTILHAEIQAIGATRNEPRGVRRSS